MSRIEYIEVPSGIPGLAALEITQGTYKGVVVAFGKVQLHENGDELNISYEYEVVDDLGNDYLENNANFKRFMNRFIHQLLNDGVENRNIMYLGGTD